MNNFLANKVDLVWAISILCPEMCDWLNFLAAFSHKSMTCFISWRAFAIPTNLLYIILLNLSFETLCLSGREEQKPGKMSTFLFGCWMRFSVSKGSLSLGITVGPFDYRKSGTRRFNGFRLFCSGFTFTPGYLSIDLEDEFGHWVIQFRRCCSLKSSDLWIQVDVISIRWFVFWLLCLIKSLFLHRVVRVIWFKEKQIPKAPTFQVKVESRSWKNQAGKDRAQVSKLVFSLRDH